MYKEKFVTFIDSKIFIAINQSRNFLLLIVYQTHSFKNLVKFDSTQS